MTNNNNFLITGNDFIAIDQFVSNFTYNKKLLTKEESLIINDSKFSIFTNIKKAKFKSQSEIIKLFDIFSDMNIPTIDINNLIKETANKIKRKQLIELGNKINNIIVITDFQSIYSDLYKDFNSIIVIIKNEPSIISNFYNLIKKISIFNFKINVIISNTKFIEEAINIFVNLKKEVKNLIALENSIDFLCNLDIDMNKLYISLKRGEPYIKIFNEDDFHGKIKFIDDKLKQSLDVIKEESFLIKLINKY